MEIVTHDGAFHADDVFAVGLVAASDGNWQRVLRTRDKQLLQGALSRGAVVIDVGGAYDGERAFDHHFVGAPVRQNGSPYAAAGLVARACSTDEEVDDLCRQIDMADNGIHKVGWTLSMTVHQCNPLKGCAEEFDYRFNYLYKLAAKTALRLMTGKLGGVEEAVVFFETDPTVRIWVKEYAKLSTSHIPSSG